MLLPFILYMPLAYSFHPDHTDFMSFYEYMNSLFGIGAGNLFFDTLQGVFGSSGAFPLTFIDTDPVLVYLSYCATIEIFHVMFDVIVFIPRLAHKWIAKVVQQD